MIGLIGALTILCLVPFLIHEYHLEIVILYLINVILVVSYRLIATTGDWSLFHIVFMGSGAYASALLAKFLGWPFWLCLPISGITAGVVGFFFMIPLHRTKVFGFLIGSFAIGEFLRLIWVKVQYPFGGARGMIGIPLPELFEIDFFYALPYYYLTLIIMIICLLIMFRVDRSRIGDAFKGIHDDEDLAKSIGINVTNYRIYAVMIGAFFAGIAGSLLAHRLQAIDPHNFDVNTMVYLIIWVVVGGSATFWGPILGVTVMTVVFEVSRPLQEWRPLLFGVILILTLIFMPGGLESLVLKCRKNVGTLLKPAGSE